MPKFEDYLRDNGSYDPESFDFQAFIDGAKTAHEDDRSVWDAKITGITETNNKNVAEISTLKSRNYDLLQLVPSDNKIEPIVPEAEEDDGTSISIDDLFKIKE